MLDFFKYVLETPARHTHLVTNFIKEYATTTTAEGAAPALVSSAVSMVPPLAQEVANITLNTALNTTVNAAVPTVYQSAAAAPSLVNTAFNTTINAAIPTVYQLAQATPSFANETCAATLGYMGAVPTVNLPLDVLKLATTQIASGSLPSSLSLPNSEMLLATLKDALENSDKILQTLNEWYEEYKPAVDKMLENMTQTLSKTSPEILVGGTAAALIALTAIYGANKLGLFSSFAIHKWRKNRIAQDGDSQSQPLPVPMEPFVQKVKVHAPQNDSLAASQEKAQAMGLSVMPTAEGSQDQMPSFSQKEVPTPVLNALKMAKKAQDIPVHSIIEENAEDLISFAATKSPAVQTIIQAFLKSKEGNKYKIQYQSRIISPEQILGKINDLEELPAEVEKVLAELEINNLFKQQQAVFRAHLKF